MPEELSLNVGEAKKRFSELIGRVAFGRATVLVTRRGRPMAKIVPPDAVDGTPHLADVKGWLEEGDAFLTTIDDIVTERAKHPARVQRHQSRANRRPKKSNR